MKELGDALGTVLTRIAGFFDVLDLSFLVAGTLNLAGARLLADALGLPLPTPPGDWLGVLLILVAAYGSGIAFFVAGRWVRGLANRYLGGRAPVLEADQALPPILRAHRLDGDPRFAPYLEPPADGQGSDEDAALRRPWRLYTRLWAELRQDPSRAASFALVRRYWVMCATCDGLAATAILWGLALPGLALAGVAPLGDHRVAAGLVAVALGGAAMLMVREANRYLRYQHEELVASLAAGVPADRSGTGALQPDGAEK